MFSLNIIKIILKLFYKSNTDLFSIFYAVFYSPNFTATSGSRRNLYHCFIIEEREGRKIKYSAQHLKPGFKF